MRENQNIKVAVDIVLFGYQASELFVLLIQQKYGKYEGHWSLPGGFVGTDEGLISAAKRELKEEAGVEVNYLEQLYTFGDDIKRDHRGRVISVSYYGLVNPSQLVLEASTDAVDAQWFKYAEIGDLPFDHSNILSYAFERLRAKLNYQPIGFNLLEKKFPFSELESLYSTILGKKIDRRNFRKKIMSLGLLKSTGEMAKKGSGRPAELYVFDEAKYKALKKSGMMIELKFV